LRAGQIGFADNEWLDVGSTARQDSTRGEGRLGRLRLRLDLRPEKQYAKANKKQISGRFADKLVEGMLKLRWTCFLIVAMSYDAR
jgi:hypothetical protein